MSESSAAMGQIKEQTLKGQTQMLHFASNSLLYFLKPTCRGGHINGAVTSKSGGSVFIQHFQNLHSSQLIKIHFRLNEQLRCMKT